MSELEAAKEVLRGFREGLYDLGAVSQDLVEGVFAPSAVVRLCFPFETMDVGGLWEKALGPLAVAWPDLERREYIRIAGRDGDGALWVGTGGQYVGTARAAWLGIPATGRVTQMRFHEFFRVENGAVVEMQALWDIPSVMMQAGAWPLAPSLGAEWAVPGPATSDGLGPHDPSVSEANLEHVVAMLTALSRHPSEGGPEVMELGRFWHPRMNWYGPAGIGTGRGIEGFRRVHQIPFLKAMPDRGQYPEEVSYHFMAEGDYVGVTGWPDMVQTVSGSGWLGIAPPGNKIEMRSLDFWRMEGGLIRENWVLVDMLHMYDQIGVDVFERMRERVDLWA